LSTVTEVASTIPANGDVNPYGIASVPFSTGTLVRGDTLVSNFNASSRARGPPSWRSHLGGRSASSPN
jgi:hypothetical protein